jgi:hypothetical protein
MISGFSPFPGGLKHCARPLWRVRSHHMRDWPRTVNERQRGQNDEDTRAYDRNV